MDIGPVIANQVLSNVNDCILRNVKGRKNMKTITVIIVFVKTFISLDFTKFS